MYTQTLRCVAVLLGLVLFVACSDEEEKPSADTCLPGEICVTITAAETTGNELRMMLYECTEDQWPQMFRTLPTPSWVVTEYPPVPESYPLRIRIPMTENLFAISSEPLDGARLGLAVATGVASIMVVEPTDARGFSDSTMVYEEGKAMDFGTVTLAIPEGDTCDMNPWHPTCQSGPLFWKEHLLGEEDFIPGAVYMDVADLDGDNIMDIVMVGEPHFEEPDLPLTVLKLGVYYLNADLSVRETAVLDAWTEQDQSFYSPWSVKVIQHGGEPMIIVGTNIPDLAPLEEGSGNIFSYKKVGDTWQRDLVIENPNPRDTCYNAMIVVICDLDADGDDDIALSGAFGSSAVGSWMENTGQADPAWIPHLHIMAADTDPHIRGTLGYKCTDLNKDGYPEVIYNAMFDIADTNPPRYRGEIWLAVNPGPTGWGAPWQKVVIDDDNWASADMWFHDYDGDGNKDLIANQLFNGTVTRYWHPGDNLADTWQPEIIIRGLTSPSDMWLADMNNDGYMDVISADHTAHCGVWHSNPGPVSGDSWWPYEIYRGIRMPGDFTMLDMDNDGDPDWAGTSMTLGQAFIVEQIQPPNSLVATISLPDDFDKPVTKLILTLANEMPVTGMPAAILATINNKDADNDGVPDVDAILTTDHDLIIGIEDVGLTGDYHVAAALYVEGGGEYQPVSGVDYMGGSQKRTFGEGTVRVHLNLVPAP